MFIAKSDASLVWLTFQCTLTFTCSMTQKQFAWHKVRGRERERNNYVAMYEYILSST